jgi:hypothetical protein
LVLGKKHKKGKYTLKITIFYVFILLLLGLLSEPWLIAPAPLAAPAGWSAATLVCPC